MRRSNAAEFPCTDAGNAELLSALYKQTLRYDHGRARWLVWGEHWWVEDKSQKVLQLAKRAARLRHIHARRITDEGVRKAGVIWARQSESKARLEAALALAQSERPLSTDGSEWDRDPWLLGVGNGVVNLRTGKLLKGKQSDLITMHTVIPFDPLVPCPRFEQFVCEIFGGDQDLIQYVQRAAGYCLAADITEQVLFLCHGNGANGKSTFLELLRHVLGDYAYNLPFSAFELKARSSIPNEIAALRGKRFVTAIETNESVQLNEARIKALTGADPITARFLYQEFFTFEPTGKLWLAVNHKPQVADDSPGFWRRVRLIPFEQQFTGDRADPDLMTKLRSEASGILAWLVQGCLAWQKDGLGLPCRVDEATKAYREENDQIGEFIYERCLVHASAQVAAGALWQAFQDWCFCNGDRWPLLNHKGFADRLEAKGFQRARVGHDRTRVWRGLRLRSFEDGQPSPSLTGNELRTHADVSLPIVGSSEESCIKQ